MQRQPNNLSVSRVLKNRFSKVLAVFLIYIIGGFPTLVFALPQEGQIVSGQGTIGQPNPNQMVINQNSNQLITNWNSFSIGQSEHVQFNQPSVDSTALNRVTGQDPSAIMGRLSANGQVFLSNSSGIIFGQSSRVNVGGLMATTLGISNEDFLNRNYHFTQDKSKPLASILNQGTITAGQVGLLAPRVENQGTIVANLGNAALSSGEAAIMDFDGSGLINFQITEPVTGEVKDANGNVVESGVVNSGFVKAHSGNVILSAHQARGMVRSVVNNTGIIEAKNVVKKGGRVFLMGDRVKNSGTINVTGTEAGQTGGTVHILGNEVNVSGGTIDASGDAGGGTVLIGGDRQGRNESIQNATNTTVGESATIKADAINKGDGGKVIIWSENSTKVYGAISAKGGANGGDGGFVETSGKKFLDVTKAANVSAPSGKAGTWLLDPTNIEIVSGPGNGDGSQISVTTIETALNAGTSVHIVTSGQGLEEGNITISTAILKSSGGDTSLTLTAHGDIIVNQTITSTNGTLDVNLIAGADILINAAIATNGGNIFADAGATNLPANISGSYTPAARICGATVALPEIQINADINTNGGNVNLGQFKTKSHSLIGGGTYTKEKHATADVTVQNASINTNGGNFTINGSAATVASTATITTPGGDIVIEGSDESIVSVSGILNAANIAANQSGGSIQVLGHKVGIFGNAQLDASGDAGGGIILIGGDYQGKNEDIQNAYRTYVSSDAVIKADAINTGNGGKVIVWADDTTRFYGNISATGGSQSGDGGFAEVSGLEFLDFNGFANLTAVAGSNGMLLLDPRNITVVNGGSEPDLVGATGDDGNANVYAFAEDASLDVTIDASVINALMSAGTTVTLQAHNDITINEAINGTGGIGGLFLQAGDDVHLNANITTGNGVINITANDAGATSTGSGTDEGTGDITVGSATIVLDAGTAVITLSAEGNISLPQLTTTSTLDAAINVTSTAGNITDGSSAVELNASGGGAVLSAATGIGTAGGGGEIDTNLAKINLTNTTSGIINVSENTAGGSLEVTGITTGGTTSTTSLVVQNTSGDLTISGNLNTVGTTALEAARDIILNASNNITLATNGSLVMQAGDDITLNSNITASGTGTLHLEADSAHTFAGVANGAGGLTLQTISTGGGAITLIGAALVSVTGVNSGSGNINLSSSIDGTAQAFSAAVTAIYNTFSTTGTFTHGLATTAGSDGFGTGAVTLNNGVVTVDGFSNTSVSNFTFASTSTVTFQNTASTFSGNLAVNATGAIAVNANAISNGSVSLTSSSTVSVASSVQVRAEDNGGSGALTISATAVTLNGGGSGTENLENVGSGNVSVTATSGDITLGNGATAFAIRSNAGDVTLNASGNIVTVTSADFEIFSDGNVTFTGNNIGLTNAIEIAGTGNGNRTLTMTVNGSGSTANVTLYDPGGGQDDLFNAINVTVAQANSAVNLDLVGAESVTGASGANHDLNATLNTNNISLTYTLSQASQILRIGTINAGTGNVTLSSAGQILDTAGNDTTTDITANTLTLTSSGSIGVDINDGLNVNATNLAIASTGGSGSAFLTEVDSLNLNSITVGTGALQISATTLVVTTAITTTGSGNITLDAADRIDVNANITAGGALVLDGDSNNAANVNDDILIANGVTLTANGGGITLDAASAASDNILAEGALTLNATNGITINHDLIGTTSGGAININADTDGNGGLFSLAASQTINAQNNALSITSDTITLTGTLQGTGALTLQQSATGTSIGLGGGSGTFNLDDTEIGNLTNGFSSITIGASGSTGALDQDAVTYNDPITIRGGNMTIDGITMGTNTDSVTIISTGTITDSGADNSAIDIAAANATVTLTSSGVIGTSAADSLNINSLILVVTSTNNNNIFITESGGSGIGTMNAGAGNITISTDGSFISNSSAITAANLDISTSGSGAALGASGTALNTTLSGTLTATASTGTGGGIFINNTGSLALGVINAGSTSGDTVELIATAGMTNSSSLITGENISLTVSDTNAAIGATGTANDINITLAGTLTATASDGNGGIFVASTGNMLVGAINASTTGNIELRAEGGTFNNTSALAITGAAVTIEATTNVSINEGITSNGTLTINADSDNNASGDFTLALATALNSSGNTMSITGNTFTLSAGTSTLNSGAGNLFLLPSTGVTVSIGTTSGTFDVDDTEIGAITTSGTLTIGDASLASAITLDTAGFGSTNLVIQTNSTISDANDTGANLTTSGTLTLTSNGVIGATTTQGINIDVASVTVTSSGGNNVILNDNGTTATTLTVTTGGAGNLEFVKSGAGNIIIGGVTTTSNITNIEASNGTITQTGALTVTGTASFDTSSASNIITLTNASNAVQGAISFTTIGSGSNVTFDNNITGVIMGTSDVVGNLFITTGGTITDTGTTTVSGTASFTTDVANQAITLDSANAITGAITFTSAAGSTTSNVTIDNGTTNLILAGTTIRGTLTATSGGTITQSGALTVDSTSSFTTDVAAQSITLDNTSNVFTGAVSLSTTGAADATIDNGTTALILGTVGIGQNLSVTAGNTITDSGVITVGGTASFTTDVNDQAITLDSSNAITGAVSFTTQTAGGNTANVTLDNGSTAINLGTLSIAGSFSGTTTSSISTSGTTTTATGLTLNANTGINFSNDITSGGSTFIDADADGVGNDGDFTISAAAAFSSGGNTISITSNDIIITTSAGTAIDSGGAATTLLVSDGGTIGLGGTALNWTLDGSELEQISATGLTIGDNTNGNITVNGITAANSNNITGTVTLNATAAGGTITFDTTASTFNALATNAETGINVTIGLATDTGTLTLDADSDNDGGGTLTITDAVTTTNSAINFIGAGFAIDTGSSNSGNANTTVEASTAVSIGVGAGAGTFSVNDTKIDNMATTGTLVIGNSGLSSAITFDNVTAGSKNISLLTSSTIDDADADATNLTTTGTLSLTSGAAIGGTNLLNIDVASVTVTSSGGNNVTITDQGTSDTTFNITTGGAGNISVTQDANNLIFSGVSTSGNLTAIATTGTITDTGTVTVGGTGTFTTSANNQAITLDTLAVTGNMFFTTSGTTGNVTIDNGTTAIIFGASTINGSLSATTGGTMSQAGALTVSGTSSFTTDVNDQAITLNNTSNALTGAVTFTTQTAGGDTGNVTIDNGTTNLVLAASTIAGSLTATTGGTITQSGALTVDSTSSFTTDVANQSITLNNTSNDFAGAVSLSTTGSGDATLDNGTTALILGTVGIGQNLVVTAGNTITDTGVITVGGTASFTTDVASNNITLDSSNAITGAVSFTTSGTGTASFNNGSTAISLGTINVGGLFTGTTTSSIATSIAFSTSGGMTLNANTGITLSHNVTTGGAVTIDTDVDNNGVGDFTISSSAVLSSTGNTISITANDIDLSTSASPAINSGAAATTLLVSDGGTMGIGDTAGAWTLSGAELQKITATGLTIGDATNGNVFVDNITAANSNNVSGTVTINATQAGSTVTFVNNANTSTFNALTVSASGIVQVDQDLTTDTGALSLTSALNNVTIANTVVSAGDLTFDNSAAGVQDVFIGAAVTAAGNVVINAADSVQFTVAASDLTASGSGSITISSNQDTSTNDNGGTITMVSGSSIDAGSGTISLTGTGANATTAMSLRAITTTNTSSSAITINSRDGLILSDNVTASGGVSINADNNADGTGDFTMQLSQTLNTNGGALSITANDFVLSGSLNSGSGATTFLISDNGTIGIDGATVGTAVDSGICGGTCAMTINGDELSRITATGLNIGDNNDGNAFISTITATNSNNISGTLTVNTGGSATFSTGESIFNALSVNAVNGITVSVDIATDTGAMTLNADSDNNGTGAFSMGTDIDLETINSNISITASDFTLDTTGTDPAIVAGSGTVTIKASNNRSIGLGVTAGDMTISGDEMARINASALTIGDSSSTGIITVDGITQAQSDNIAGTTTLLANAAINFQNTNEFFNNVTAQGSSVTTTGTLTTTQKSGNLILGVSELAGTFGDNSGSFTVDITVNGTLVSNNFSVSSTVAWVDTGIAISAGDSIIITATGTVDLGGGNITPNGPDGSQQNDVPTDALNDAASEQANHTTLGALVGKIGGTGTASDGTGFYVGSSYSSTGNVTLTSTSGNVSMGAINSAGNLSASATGGTITDTGVLTALGTGSFTTSTANNAITLDSANAITGAVSFSTSGATGDVSFNNGSTALNMGASTIGGQLTATTTSSISTSGAISTGAALTLNANTGILLSNNVTSSGAVTIDADVDNNAAGTFTIDSGDTLSTSAANQTISIIADDVAINGSIASGSGNITISPSTGISIGLGAGAGTMSITDAELDNISTTGTLTIGDGTLTTTVTVDGVTNSTASTFSIIGTDTASTGITFSGTASTFSGALNLSNPGSIFLSANVTTGNVTSSITADNDGNSSGDLQIATGVTLSAGTLNITADDIAINGTGAINVVNHGITIKHSANGLINLGSTASADMTISGAELQQITAGTVTFGDASHGNMIVDGISEANSDNIATQVLLTTGGSVTFSTGDSTFNGLTVNAANGIALNRSVTVTTGAQPTFNSDTDANGTGDFTIAAGQTLTGGGGTINITANDVTISGTINASAAPTIFLVSDSGSIGLGATAGDWTLDGSELQNITATGLTIGDNNDGNITVNGISAANSNNISGTLSLNTGGSASFDTADSTFNALAVNAVNGITLNRSVTTDTGSASFNSDSDANGTGDFTIAASQTLSTNNNTASITANDITLTGSINAGASGNVNLLISDSGTIGIGATAGNWTLDGAELQNITANTMTIGDTNDGAVTIDGISNANSQNITTTLLINSGGLATVASASTFNVISIDAIGGITVSGDLTSDTGDMTLDANTGTLTVAGQALNATGGSSNVTLTADAVDLQAGSSITGSDTFTLQASTAGTTIGIGSGSTGTINLTDTEVGFITAASFTSVVIGASGATGAIDFNTTSISKNLTVRGGAFDNSSGLSSVTGSFTAELTATSTISALTSTSTINIDMAGNAQVLNIGGALMASNAVTLTSDDDIIFTDVTADITSTTGGVTLTADSDANADAGTGGAITLIDNGTDGIIIDAGDGDIALSADENITLGRLVTTSSSNTAVVLTSASGAIVDDGDSGSPDVTATNGRLVIDAVTGIGTDGSKGANAADDAIDIQVASIDFDNSTSGNVNFEETDDLDIIKGAHSGTGNIVINAGGDVTGTANLTANNGSITVKGNIIDNTPPADPPADPAPAPAPAPGPAPAPEPTPTPEPTTNTEIDPVVLQSIGVTQDTVNDAVQSTFVQSFGDNGGAGGGGC